MFIEPRLSICVDGITTHRYPDIVICNSRNVIAVVELKYLPRTAPRYRKDIATLQLISRNRTGVRVANQRHKGPTRDAREYALGRDVLFAWAGVYYPASGSLEPSTRPMLCGNAPELERCFLQLHAETRPNGPPRVFARSN
jgi:hypothetical protein